MAFRKSTSYAVDGKSPPAPLFTVGCHRRAQSRQAGPGRRACWRSTKSIRPAGATCWCIASENRSRLSPQPAPTSARRRLSPDGRWIAYVSDASGRDEVYVTPLDRSVEALQMTSGGATEPVWTREGLFYRAGRPDGAARARDRRPGDEPRVMFEGHFERDPGCESRGLRRRSARHDSSSC